MNAKSVALIFFIAVCLAASPSYAYIDPGTGSFIIQGIIAAVVGAGVVLRMFWGRIKARVTGKPSPSLDDDE